MANAVPIPPVVNYNDFSQAILDRSQEHRESAQEITRLFNENLPRNPIEREAYLEGLQGAVQITAANLGRLEEFLADFENHILPQVRQARNIANLSLQTLRPRMEAEQVANNRWVYPARAWNYLKDNGRLLGAAILGVGGIQISFGLVSSSIASATTTALTNALSYAPTVNSTMEVARTIFTAITDPEAQLFATVGSEALAAAPFAGVAFAGIAAYRIYQHLTREQIEGG